MLDAPSIICRVVRPIVGPVVAAPGDILAVWPGHPTHTLAVVSGDKATLLRHCFCADGAVYGLVLDWFLDARIRLPLQDQRALLTQRIG